MPDKNKTKAQLIAESQANLLSFIENRNESIWSIDRSYNFIIFNSFFANDYLRAFNIKLKPGLSALDILTPELRQFWEPKYKAVLAGQKMVFEFPAEIEGTMRTYEIFLNPIIEDEEITGVSGISTEITDRKKAEEALAHSHDLMSYIIEHSRSAIAVHDRDMNYIYVSQRYLDEYKVKEQDVIGKHHYEVFPDLPQKWRDVHQKALAGETSSAEDDPYEREDGTVDWTRWECRPWYEADGSVGGIIVYTEVITERKQAEEELIVAKEKAEESEKYLNNIINNIGDPVFVKDNQSRLLVVNDAFCKIFGLQRGEILGKTLAEDVSPDEQESFLRIDKQVLMDGQENINEETLTIRDAETRTISTRKTRFLDENGKKYLVGVIRDISERMLAEEALKESEYKFRSVLETIQLFGLMLDTEANIIFVNDYLLKFTGWQRQEVIGKNWFELFIPGIIEKDIKKVFHKTLVEDNVVNSYTNDIVTKSGEIRRITWSNTTHYNNEHKPVSVTSIGEDITERMQAEKELLKHRDHLEEMVKERTADLEEKNKELDEYNKLFIGREYRIKELRDKVKAFEEKYGKLD